MMTQKEMTGRKTGAGAKTLRKLLCLIMALLLAFGTASFAEEAETDSLEMILSGMTLREFPAEGSPWISAILPEGLLACFGVGEAGGTLPVNIPGLDKKYQPFGEILWNRGEAFGRTKK